jgi:hypothetical protein
LLQGLAVALLLSAPLCLGLKPHAVSSYFAVLNTNSNPRKARALRGFLLAFYQFNGALISNMAAAVPKKLTCTDHPGLNSYAKPKIKPGENPL